MTAAAEVLLSCASVRKNVRWANGDLHERTDARQLDRTDKWREVLDAAEFHGLLQLLYWNIGRNGADLLPADVSRRLHQGYQESVRRSLFLAASLAEMSAQFEAAGIPVIALKGPPLAESLYGDAALRQSFDLDLLLQPADVPAAFALLGQSGYELAPHLARLPIGWLLRLDSEVTVHSRRGAPIELHWAISPDDYPFRFDAGVLWRSRQAARIAGQDIQVLAPECLLMYLCVHGAKHAWSRLHWLGDVARLVEKGVEWPAALALAAETRCERPFFLGALLAHDLLDAPVPADILEGARGDRLIVSAVRETAARLRCIPPVEPSSTARTAYNARLARTTLDSVRHWAAMFKAPKDEDLRRCHLPSWLFFLYYPLRAQRLAAKYAQRLMGGPER